MKQPIEVEKGKNKVNIREKYIIRELGEEQEIYCSLL